MTVDTPKRTNKALIGFIVIVVLAIIATGVVALTNNGTTTTQTSDTSATNETTTSGNGTNNATAATGNYKDGTYSAEGTYQTPGGRESIDVTVTLAGGIISDVSVSQNASSGEAAEYQEAFVSEYKTSVSGKNINDVSLSRVAGASLTPLGFNNALDKIKSDAAA